MRRARPRLCALRALLPARSKDRCVQHADVVERVERSHPTPCALTGTRTHLAQRQRRALTPTGGERVVSTANLGSRRAQALTCAHLRARSRTPSTSLRRPAAPLRAVRASRRGIDEAATHRAARPVVLAEDSQLAPAQRRARHRGAPRRREPTSTPLTHQLDTGRDLRNGRETQLGVDVDVEVVSHVAPPGGTLPVPVVSSPAWGGHRDGVHAVHFVA